MPPVSSARLNEHLSEKATSLVQRPAASLTTKATEILDASG